MPLSASDSAALMPYDTDMEPVDPAMWAAFLRPQLHHVSGAAPVEASLWPAFVVDAVQDFLHVLDPNGRFTHVSPSCQSLTGHTSESLIGNFINHYVHPDDVNMFTRELNDSFSFGTDLRFFYRFRKYDGSYMIFECNGHPHLVNDVPATMSYPDIHLSGMSSIHRCLGFFMVARPYPMASTYRLDSLLELKTENIRLMKQIGRLQREEAEEFASDNTVIPELESRRLSVTNERMGPPPTPRKAHFNQSLEEGEGREGLPERSTHTNAANNHLTSIEMMTGHEINLNGSSPVLSHGGQDIKIVSVAGNELEEQRKTHPFPRKKENFECDYCGTMSTPEMRRGPKGPNTLCNACGLRYSKSQRASTHSWNPKRTISQQTVLPLATKKSKTVEDNYQT